VLPISPVAGLERNKGRIDVSGPCLFSWRDVH
jgi:hypothetical protein